MNTYSFSGKNLVEQLQYTVRPSELDIDGRVEIFDTYLLGYLEWFRSSQDCSMAESGTPPLR